MMATTSRNLAEEVPSVMREPSLNEVLRGNKSNENMSSKESPLKRAMKENENSIIQSILHTPSPPSTSSSGKDKSGSGGKSDSDENAYLKKGLSPLLDYLFEDGQLTRIEYDFIDKGFGGTEQIQMLLKILIETKDEEAFVTLLDYLRKQDPNSESIRRLSQNFLPEQKMRMRGEIFQGHPSSSSTVIGVKGLREVIEATKSLSLQNNTSHNKKEEGDDDIDSVNSQIISLGFERNVFTSVENSSRSAQWDFYYGRNHPRRSSRFPSESDSGASDRIAIGREGKENERTTMMMSKQQQLSKRNLTRKNKNSVTMDVRDFYMTNGCLETARNLILERGSDGRRSCVESLTAAAWERVLQNMNGLLSTDVLSIKEFLFHHQRQQLDELRSRKDHIQIQMRRRREMEGEDEKGINNLVLEDEEGDETRLGNAMMSKHKTSHSHGEEEERASSNDPPMSSQEEMPDEEDIEFQGKETLDWEQILYYSLQIWKLRNGRNSTFYSLVGVFQHSALYQTADFLLANKMEIQSKESEKESADVFPTTGLISSSSSSDKRVKRASTSNGGGTMLEKSDFLRKFYSSAHSANGNTMNERLCVSPILSLDLLL